MFLYLFTKVLMPNWVVKTLDTFLFSKDKIKLFAYFKVLTPHDINFHFSSQVKYCITTEVLFEPSPGLGDPFVVQWIFDLRKFFDLRKNFTVPKILVHKLFDLRKISKTPFLDLRKKNWAFWGKKGNFCQKMLKL